MYRYLKKHLEPWVRLYSIIPLISVFTFNSLVYWITMFECKDWYHYDLTLPFDRAVPLAPEFVFIYLGCYLFWAAKYAVHVWLVWKGRLLSVCHCGSKLQVGVSVVLRAASHHEYAS